MGNTTMLSFRANRSSLVYRRESCCCAVFLMRDRHTQPGHLPYDFQKAPLVTHSVWGEVSSVDNLYLVMESVKRDAEQGRVPEFPLPPSAQEGSSSLRSGPRKSKALGKEFDENLVDYRVPNSQIHHDDRE